MKKTFLILMMLTAVISVKAQDETPSLKYVFEVQAVCDKAYQCGETPMGVRNIIPIIGGQVVGPEVNGKIIPGGADYQLIESKTGRTQLEAIYSFTTDDGINIHVRNVGVLSDGPEGRYFRTSPKFEAPEDSKYGWLNNCIFICVPTVKKEYISLKMYKVE